MRSDDIAEQIHPRLAWHLENWRDWMRLPDTRQLEAPGMARGFVGGGYSQEFDTMVRCADVSSAITTDALISSLSVVQSAAVHHWYLRSVYRFPRSTAEIELERACRQLLAWMVKRGMIQVLTIGEP